MVAAAAAFPEPVPPSTDLPAYARGFAQRAANTAWLLGAGASADAGVPTASQLVDELLAQLYCTENNVPPDRLRTEPRWRDEVRAAYDGLNGLPRLEDDAFYSAVFDRALGDRDARARFIVDQFKDKTPHIGQTILAGLVAAKQASFLVTTNFDMLLEDAIDLMLAGTSDRLTRLFPESAAMAQFTTAIDARPLLVKIHGTMGAVTLLNTAGELETHDANLRDAVLSRLSSFGLIVVGYSGRDDAVMSMLEEVLDHPSPYPAGLTWVRRPEDDVPGRVLRLLERAQSAGVEPVQQIVTSGMVELMNHIEVAVSLPPNVRDRIDQRRPPALRTPAHGPTGPMSDFPQLRLAALPVLTLPTTARLLNDNGARPMGDIRSALRAAHSRGMVARRRGQLVAFGDDTDLHAALHTLGISVTDEVVEIGEPVGNAEPESTDRGIYAELIARALGRTRGVGEVLRSNHRHLLRVRDNATGAPENSLKGLRDQAGPLTGVLQGPAGSTLPWAEALSIGLDWRDGQPWLLFAPDIWLRQNLLNPPDTLTDAAQHALATRMGAEFVRDRLASRYNSKTSGLLTAWLRLLIAGASDGRRTVHAFNLGDRAGVDATFQIGARPLVSQRLVAPTNG